MEKLLKEIVETDKASRLDVEKAKQRREALTQELAETKKQIEAEYKLKSDSATKNAKQAADAEIKKFKAQLQQETDLKISALTKAYDERHTEWEKAITSAVTESK